MIDYTLTLKSQLVRDFIKKRSQQNKKTFWENLLYIIYCMFSVIWFYIS